MKKIKITFSFIAALTLTACGQESTPTAAYQALEDNKPNKALTMARAQLAANPESPVFNSIAIMATFQKCLENNCFATANNATDTLPTEFTEILSAQTYATAPVPINDETTLNLAQQISALTPQIIALPNQPEPLVAALAITPEYARSPLIIALSQSIQSALLNNDIATATKLLHPMTRENVFPKGVRHLAAYAFGTLSNKDTFANANLVALKAHKGADVPASLWAILPLVWHELAPQSDTSKEAATQSALSWLQRYDALMPELIELMPPHAWQETARILGVLTTQDTDRNVAITTRQLALWPNDEATWRNYIPAISAYLTDTGDVDLLALIDPLNVPESVRTAYNTMLFNLVPVFDAAGRDGLPLLKQVALQEMPKPSQVRLEKLVKAGLDASVSRQNPPLIMRYARFRPSVAESSRPIIVPAMIEGIETEFKANDFKKVLTYSAFLKDTLKVEFELNAFLLNTYKKVLATEKVAETLSADSPDWLLMDKPYNLGAKFAFLQTRMAETPQATDDILKNLVSSARGIYGTPTAFYRLMHLFNDTTFPPSERLTYLRASIQSSLESDEELSALATAGLGDKLYKKHHLSLNFVAMDALSRTEGLEDERQLWKNAPNNMKEAWKASSSAFATLMRAIDQFDAGDKTSAAALFNQINNAYYLNQAAPYLAHYAKTVNQSHGWYVPLDITQSAIGLIGIQRRQDASSGGLADLTVTLMNQLGSQSAINTSTYATNHSAIYTAHIPTTLNFDNNTLPLKTEEIEQVPLPEPFEDIFGALSTLQLAAGTSGAPLLKIEYADGTAPQTFLRVATNTSLPLAPHGTFTITSEVNEHKGIAGILPKGAKITLRTDLDDPIQLMGNNTPLSGRIFPLTGKLSHPLGTQPLPIKGFYNPETHLIDVQFTYPLTGSDGRLAKAAARCQLLGRILVCGSHPSHINRHQYSVISTGKLIQSDWKEWQKQQQNWADKIEASQEISSTTPM